MSELNTYYRAFLEYRRGVSADAEISKLKEAIKRATAEVDRLESVRACCVIEEDWIEAIEEGLVYVEKAVHAERQFITQNGEVIPIEKVRHVSPASVTHLAKHGNLITRMPEEGQDLTPEQLFVEEKLSDYAVYENRFLYMLLCNLRDFIDLRLQKINELGSTYRAEMKVQKDFYVRKRRIRYEVNYREENKRDPFVMASTGADALISRIEDAQRVVMSLLNTPLMKEVAKSPMIRPPVTRTNVLKMNNDFKHALALYDFISAYTKDGYRIEEIRTTYAPLSDELLDEYAQVIALTSFLTYEYGNKMEGKLRAEYDAEEEALREKEKEALIERVRVLKKKLTESGQTSLEYLMALEDANRELMKDHTGLKEAKKKLASLDEQMLVLQKERAALLEEITAREEKLDETAREIDRLHTRYDVDMAQAAEEHRKAMEEKDTLHAAHLQEERERMYADRRAAEDALRGELSEAIGERDRAKEEKRLCEASRVLAMAQLHGLRQQHGLITSEEDFSSRERFEELEREYAAFQVLFKKQWKNSKKRIRKEIFSQKQYPEELLAELAAEAAPKEEAPKDAPVEQERGVEEASVAAVAVIEGDAEVSQEDGEAAEANAKSEADADPTVTE